MSNHIKLNNDSINGGTSLPCECYSDKDGICLETGELCDMCYENSTKEAIQRFEGR